MLTSRSIRIMQYAVRRHASSLAKHNSDNGKGRMNWLRATGILSGLGAFTLFNAYSYAYAEDKPIEVEVPDNIPEIDVRHTEGGAVSGVVKSGIKIFTGRANPELAQEIAGILNVNLGDMNVSRFSDGEVKIQVNDNVRGKDVYIIQPTCPPVNENLMELMLMVSTLRRASARRITVVIPYYGYARQDRKMTSRVPISAADVARLLEAMGVDRVVAMDLHCGQIQGFFGPRVPVDNLDGGPVGAKYFASKNLENPVVVSPDAGGVYRAKRFRERLTKDHNIDASLAMIIKQRQKAGSIEKMDLVGSVDGCDVVIVDDMIDTAGTLCLAASELKKHGAKRVFAFASHGLFSGPASDRIARSVLEEVVVVNTIPLNESSKSNPKIVQLSVAHMLASCIQRIHHKQSVSEIFKQSNKE